ncbi:unnamed protein product [Amoebophrya sp. A25]|nr:unnamed protein product [Amoebophrya sp. A25]|eukprot:GSA25T00004178001.1
MQRGKTPEKTEVSGIPGASECFASFPLDSFEIELDWDRAQNSCGYLAVAGSLIGCYVAVAR